MLVLSRKPDEGLLIGDNIRVSVLGIKGNQVRLGIDAPKDIPVHRHEIYARIQAARTRPFAVESGQVMRGVAEYSRGNHLGLSDAPFFA